MVAATVRLSAIAFAGAILASCAGCTIIVPDDGTVTLVSFNVENLFDHVADGSEYEEFRPDSGWSEIDVEREMSVVAEALSASGEQIDILVLSEIENRRALDMLLDGHLPDWPLVYRAAAESPATATTVALASRYPILDVRTLLPRTGTTPALRPMLEVRLDLGHGELLVIANHWKSKRGGAAATEPLRRASARLLASRLSALARAEPETPVLVCGDFNVEPDELDGNGWAWPTALVELATLRELAALAPDERPTWATDSWLARPDALVLARDGAAASETPGTAGRRGDASTDADTGVPVGVPPHTLVDLWNSSDSPGSYWFISRWERIDGIFASPSLHDGWALEVESFQTLALAGALDSEGRPLSRREGGVSDHLPLLVRLARLD